MKLVPTEEETGAEDDDDDSGTLSFVAGTATASHAGGVTPGSGARDNGDSDGEDDGPAALSFTAGVWNALPQTDA